MADIMLKKKDFLTLLFKLEDLYCEHSRVLKVDSILFEIWKGNNSVQRLISFKLYPFKTPLPLKSFGLIDKICEEFGVEVDYQNDIFHFRARVDIYEN